MANSVSPSSDGGGPFTHLSVATLARQIVLLRHRWKNVLENRRNASARLDTDTPPVTCLSIALARI